MLIDMEDGRLTEGERTIGYMVERAARCWCKCADSVRCALSLQAYEIDRGPRSLEFKGRPSGPDRGRVDVGQEARWDNDDAEGQRNTPSSWATHFLA
jgi:hypothetical protein